MSEESCIVTTNDGSNSLRHALLGELYHSDRGAFGESMHVFIFNGFCYAAERGLSKIVVFEAGFGSGLNAWLTLQKAQELGVEVDYYAVELYPVALETAEALNYTQDELFMEMHRAAFGVSCSITDSFRLTKFCTNLEGFDFEALGVGFDVVYYDAFAPDVQPELWSSELFGRLYSAVAKGGVITTYTAKGIVKRAMRDVGFEIERLEGALGKRHQIRATKQ